MKITNLRFYAIKIFILLLVNTFVFALSFILMQILGTLSVTGLDETANYYLRCLIAATVSQIVYLVYIYSTDKSIRDRTKPVPVFVRRETVAYALMMLIPTVNAFIVGYDGLPSSPVGQFFLPNELFFFATRNPVLGFALAVMLYAATVWAAYRINLKKHPADAAEKEIAQGNSSGELPDAEDENDADKDSGES